MQITINIQFVPFNKIIMKSPIIEVKYSDEKMEPRAPVIYASPQTTGITGIELQSQEDFVDRRGFYAF